MPKKIKRISQQRTCENNNKEENRLKQKYKGKNNKS